MDSAKIFQTGRSQAVRLPKAYRFQTDEVWIRRTPEGILLIPKTGQVVRMQFPMPGHGNDQGKVKRFHFRGYAKFWSGTQGGISGWRG